MYVYTHTYVRVRARMCGNASFGALRPPIYYSNFRDLRTYV